ncbi:hypothetical protein GWK08_07405 [Leptobacterium flavescens]|uniref:Uncharacterized protein n=1 Tax=Leptobacterium flavescens TaxID=472055 RepID=A0A6P0UIR9_9FLAO|nr:hypothetical protein [Leptobacterium flavescens]NER13261.1 hypothetical protein [Leptobacterium flavescens]
MSKDVQPQNSSEEVDLGQLFKLIGNAFNKFFNFIASIFKGLFHLLILLLLFLQKHFIKFAIAGVIGLAIGFYLDLRRGDIYESSMVVEPNFNSVQQLYNNISFYNELAQAQDSTSLAQALKITEREAASIKKVFAESYSDENQKVKLFDDFIRQLDTNTIKVIDFESYLKNFNSLDARFHKITVVSDDNTIAKKVQPEIVSSISANIYFKIQKQTSDENLKLQDSLYNKQSQEIDSLQKLYRQVMIKTAENPGTGTSINLADNNIAQNRELELIKQMDLLKENIVELNEEKANKANIINVISDFPARGARANSLFKSYKFLIFTGFISFTLLILLLLELNHFLKSYKNSKTE